MRLAHFTATFLFTAFAVIGFAFAEPAKKEKESGGAERISLERFEEMRKGKDVVVLDVRTPEEFAEGHVPGAVNVPIAADDFEQRVAALEKDKTYLVMCGVGVRSKTACGKMKDLNLKAVYDFSGGMKAWKGAGKPVESGAGGAGSSGATGETK